MADLHHQRRRSSDLAGKVVMVTGASSGIGRELCLDLANSGFRIIAAARRTDRLVSLCRKINDFPITSSLSFSSVSSSSSSSSPAELAGAGEGVRAVAVELDVAADGAAIDASVEKAWMAFGRIDVLVNNAGIRGNVKSPLDLTEEEWDDAFKTNMKGLWLVSKCVCTRMRDAKIGGSVINISSIADLNRGLLPGCSAYAASKAAVNTLTKMMALEMGVYNIRVNSIAPGLFRSEITKGLMEKDWLENVAKKTVPLRTFGTIDPALTSLLRYLIKDSTEYVTGNIFIVDAGATLPGVPIYSSL